jgi:hypothetical protein
LAGGGDLGEALGAVDGDRLEPSSRTADSWVAEPITTGPAAAAVARTLAVAAVVQAGQIPTRGTSTSPHRRHRAGSATLTGLGIGGTGQPSRGSRSWIATVSSSPA